jgi:lysozyme family protein
MAQLNEYLKKIPNKLEGNYYLPNDVAQGVGTSCGCSVGSILTATGQKISEEKLKTLRCSDTLVQKTIAWHWHKVNGDQYPQEVAEIFVDFVFNKGLGRCIIIQNMLIHRYKADIVADGIWGAKSTGALLAAIEKFGTDHVYNSIYAWRWAFYKGMATPDKTGSKNAKGYEKPELNLQDSRLTRYFPPKGSFNPIDLLKPVDTEGVAATDVYMNAAKAGASEMLNTENPNQMQLITVFALSLTVILGVFYFMYKILTK